MKHANLSETLLLGRSSILRPDLIEKFRSFALSLGFSEEAIIAPKDLGKFACDITNINCLCQTATQQKTGISCTEAKV